MPSQQTHQDAHLAHAFSRARSNTVQSLSAGDPTAALTGHSPTNINALRSSPPRSSPSHISTSAGSRHSHGHGHSHGHQHGRRPSEMLSPEELAQQQAEQDALFFGGNSPQAMRHRGPSFSSPARDAATEPLPSPAVGMGGGGGSSGVEGRPNLTVSPVSPMVGRFYQNARHGSSSSVNSDAAFIDHRSLQMFSASPSVARTPGIAKRQASGLRGEVNAQRSPPGRKGRDRERERNMERDAEDNGFELGDAVLKYPETSSDEDETGLRFGSPSSRGQPSAASKAFGRALSRDHLRADEADLSASASTARPARALDSNDLQGSALDEQDDPSSLPKISGPTHLGDAGDDFSNFGGYHDDLGRRMSDLPPHLALGSRRPSDSAAVEADVCFPHFQAPEAEGVLDPSAGVGPAGAYQPALPGLLPGYPIPFDFSALEEFATREKETNGVAIDRKVGRHGRPAGISFASEDDVGGLRRRTRLRKPDEASSADGPSRKLSDSTGGPTMTTAGNRRQRKLALFEGADTDVATASSGAGAGAAGNDTKPPANGNTIIDFKTPLLDKSRRAASVPAYRATGGGGMNGGLGMAGGLGGDHRPYRFSFYSNALPATIHARSLAEIPAEGQTFEELFVGRKVTEHDHSAAPSETGRDGEGSGPVPNSVPGTGAATPQAGVSYHSAAAAGSGATMSQSASASGINSLKATGSFKGPPPGHSQSGKATPIPQAIPFMPGMSAAAAASRQAREWAKAPRQTIMRTEEDAEANTWWLDVLCPTDSEMKVLSKVFGIHPLTTEDIQMEETREKIELFRNYYLVCFRSFDQDPYSPTYLEPLNMYIIVFREGTLSFHFRGTPHPQNVRRRIKQLKDYINVTSDWISYALIDDITDAFGPLIQSIEYEVDSVDELVLILKEAEQSDMLRRIGTCRKKVMGLLRLMGNKADVVKGLSKRCNENWSVAPKSDIGLYLSDIQDHLVTMLANLNHYEKILSRSHSNYLAQISIEMTDASNQINDVLSKLTALGSILVPMNLVTGLWGMNVHVPGEDIKEGYTWFISIVCALLGFALLGGWLTFKFFKWSH